MSKSSIDPDPETSHLDKRVPGTEVSPVYFDVVKTLLELSKDNQKFFQSDDSEFGQRFFEAFRGIELHLTSILPVIKEIQELAPKYDFGEVPANGYRSFLIVVHSAVMHSLEITKRVAAKKDKVLFRKGFYVRETEACCHLLASLTQCLEHLQTLSTWSEVGELFPIHDRTPYDLLSTGPSINQYCFYGRCLGFQFCDSMQNVLKLIIIFMTSFSEVYYSQGNLLSKATSSVWESGKYLLDPELRAQRVVNIAQHASIDFCKSFWFLAESEIMQIVPRVTPSQVSVNKVISIPPEPLEYTRTDGTVIKIPVPSSHTGNLPIQVRLISSTPRLGMIGESTCSPASPGLLFHCHGGGFVAQSSRAHLIYLRDWATQLNVPILSVDYSLAPEAPYPRATEEILYAYVWALNNANLLGTTAERIVFAGDSAGGNLVAVLGLKCIDLGIRQADGIFLAYTPVMMNFLPTPARMLCLMDPLLPLGFMLRCIKAYAVPPESKKKSNRSSTESFEEITESDLMELQAHKSARSGTSDHQSDTLTNVSLSSSPGNNLDSIVLSTANDWSKLEDGPHEKLSPKDIDDFSKFVNCLDAEDDGTSSVHSARNWNSGIRNRMTTFVGAITTAFTKWTDHIQTKLPGADAGGPSDADRILNMREASMDIIQNDFSMTIPKDPFLSPFVASDENLKQFPPVNILSVELDPCLDDCVSFAKKLKSVGIPVELDVLRGLPHGFLNFAMFSKEAHDGSKQCLKRIGELLNLEESQKNAV